MDLLKKNSLKPKPYLNALKEGYYQRHRGQEVYKYVRADNQLRYYLNNKRIKNVTFLGKILEKIKLIIKRNNKVYKLISIYFLDKIK